MASAFMTLTEAASTLAFDKAFNAAAFAKWEKSEFDARAERYVAAVLAAREPARAAGLPDDWNWRVDNGLTRHLPPECIDLFAVVASNKEAEAAIRPPLVRAMNEIRQAGEGGQLVLHGRIGSERRHLKDIELVGACAYIDHLLLDGFTARSADDADISDVILLRSSFEAWVSSKASQDVRQVLPTQAAVPPAAKRKRGRPNLWDWDKIDAAALGLLDDLGAPGPKNSDLPTQTALVDRLLVFCIDEWDNHPSPSIMHERVAKLTDVFIQRRISGNSDNSSG